MKTLLVIDDDISVMNSIRRGLGDKYRFYYANNLVDACFTYLGLVKVKIDLIICDFDLGSNSMNGDEFIFKFNRFYNTPCILYTGSDTSPIKYKENLTIVQKGNFATLRNEIERVIG